MGMIVGLGIIIRTYSFSILVKKKRDTYRLIKYLKFLNSVFKFNIFFKITLTVQSSQRKDQYKNIEKCNIDK